MVSLINNFKPRVLMAISLVFVLTSIFGMAQKKVSAAKKQEARERAMVIKNYKEKSVDGLVVKLLDRKGNAVDPAASFKSGDEVKISLISNFGGYVYFVNVTPGGKTKVFWHTRVDADEEYALPQGKDVIAFDNGRRVVALEIEGKRRPYRTSDGRYYLRIGAEKRNAATI